MKAAHRNSKMFDLGTIAMAVRRGKRAVERRAQQEAWAFETRAVRGGQQRLFRLTSLPADVQLAVLGKARLEPQLDVVQRQDLLVLIDEMNNHLEHQDRQIEECLKQLRELRRRVR